MSSPSIAAKIKPADLKGKVAIITGASRGIGRVCALALAKHGCAIVVAAKSTVSTAKLPGSIHTVADEVRALGAKALPFQIDLRDAKAMEALVDATIKEFGRIDILINNASALWWHQIATTPINKYDLITSINTRGSFYLTKLCMPHMQKQKYGRVITMSPPIQTHPEAYKGFTAYNISKFGMTMTAFGAAAEGGEGVTGNSLWPATVIESQASENFQLMEKSNWRKATILADCVLSIVADGGNGRTLIDDEYLVSRGVTPEELAVYRWDPNVEPPRVLASTEIPGITRGDVRQVDQDNRTSKL